jgi:hypothetical protein
MNPGRPVLPGESNDVPDEFVLQHTCLAQIADPRHPKGKLYPQPAVLSLVVLGLMAGCRSLSAIMRYGQNHPEMLPSLGFRWVLSVPALSRVLAGVDPAAVRMALQAFTRELAERRRVEIDVEAVDGKTLRGVLEGSEPLHMLHLFAHRGGMVLDQLAVGKGKGEMTAAKAWIAEMASQYPGLSVLTADALYADRDLCAAIVAVERDYLIRLKKTR